MLPNQEEEGVCSVRLYWNVEVSPAMVAFRGSELPQFIILLAEVFQREPLSNPMIYARTEEERRR